jgi:hypothetical protein
MNHLKAFTPTALCHMRNQLLTGNQSQLAASIDQLLAEKGDTVLLAINKFLANPFHLSVLIHHVLRTESFLDAVLKESYYHENGFHKIVLLSGQSFKLRLHHFGSGVKLPMENVHDHRWAFASSILAGSLKMDLFEVHECEGEALIHYRYDSNKSTGEYTTTRVGKKFIRKTETRTYSAGDQYLMLPTDLHRIINKAGEESITLILTGNPKGQTCNLYAKRTIRKEEKKMVSYSEEMEGMLKALSEKIYPVQN